MFGIVKFFNKHKGYGFIIDSATQKEIFVHFSSIRSTANFRQLEQGSIVSYKIKTHKKFKKEQAFEVSVRSIST